VNGLLTVRGESPIFVMVLSTKASIVVLAVGNIKIVQIVVGTS
jgi:hypothetical protein